MVIYYSKINLITENIFKLYSDANSNELRKILAVLLGDMKSGIYYDEEISHFENGDLVKNRIRYNLMIRNKTDTYIEGVIYKRSKIFYKDIDEGGTELVPKSVDSIEAILFYFDVFNEVVGFHTTKRFGYQEFNYAFKNIVNKCLEINKRNLSFDVALRTEGLDISEIIEQLEKINKIKELKFKYQPPNPDQDTLDAIERSGETFVTEMSEANVTGMSYVFNSSGTSGINLNSKIIKENLNDIKSLSNMVKDKKAIGKGYISVEAIGRDGKKYTTADQKPVKSIIDRIEEFKESCISTIRTLL